MSVGDLVAGSVDTVSGAAGTITASPFTAPTPGNTRFCAVRCHSVDPTDIHAPDGGWTLARPRAQIVSAGGASNNNASHALYYRVVVAGDATNVTYSTISFATEIGIWEVEGTFATPTADDFVSSSVLEGSAPWDHFIPCGSLAVTAPALVVGLATTNAVPNTIETFSINRGTMVEHGHAGANAPTGLSFMEYITSSQTVTPIGNYNSINATDGKYGFMVVFAGPATPTEPGPIIVVEDPGGVQIGELTDVATDPKFRIELNGTGFGSFKVNRRAVEATAALLTPGNYVKVTIPQIDPNPIFGFFLEGSGAPDTPTITLVSTDEQGGEMASFGGRGGLSYWARAIWLAQSFLVDWWPAYMEAEHGTPPAGTLGMVRFLPGTYARYTVSGNQITSKIVFTTAGGFSSYYDSRKRYYRVVNGVTYWTTLVHLTTSVYNGWYVKPWGTGVLEIKAAAYYRFGNSILMESIDDGNKPGQVLYQMYQESQAASRPIHPLPLLTVDFNATTDSDGNAWTTTEALRAVSTELGDDYLSTVGKLANTGAVDVVMGPDLDFHAYNAYGRDLTGIAFGAGVVRFVKAVNIADELQRQYDDAPSATFAEIQGQSEGIIARVTAAGSPPREISIRGDSDDVTVLEDLGDAELALRQLHSDTVAFAVATPIIGHEDAANGLYLPGPPGSANGNYWIGDLVSLHTGTGEHDFNNDEVRIAAITLTFEEHDLRAIVEVISGFGGIPTLGSSTDSGATSGVTSPSTLSDLYQLVSERDQPSGYAGLDDNGRINPAAAPTQWKQSVRSASTANGTLATAFEATDTLDGITLAEGDEILLKDQTAGVENGIYIVNATGAPTRRPDFDLGEEVLGAVILVREGTANAGTTWRLTNTTEPTVDTDALTFAAFASGTGAPTTADYLVGTAQAGLSAEIVVGTTPGGELGGTWASPTVDATHAGSTHIALSSATPLVESGAGSAGTGTAASKDDHVHPAAAGSGTLSTVKDEGSTLSSAVTSLDFVGAGVTATGTTAVTVTIPGGGGSSWPPLDQYSIDGTYGDHFTGASLSGSWTRRNYTSGAEAYQAGYNSTFLRISKAGRANGDGYFRTAPAGDWTFAMAFIPRLYNTNSMAWGIGVVDTNGTGVATCVYNAPTAPLLISMTTYSSYGGTYVQVGSTSAGPNLAVWDSNTVRDRKFWVYLRKSGTSYYTAVSLDGEVWSPESGAQTWAGTVDRVGMMDAPLGSITSGQGYGSYVDVDWFNKIA